MITRERQGGYRIACVPGDPPGVTLIHALPRDSKEVHDTKASTSAVDSVFCPPRKEFQKIRVKYAFMRRAIILLSLLFGAVTPAVAQLSIGIGLPNVSIGINVPLYPEFEQVPGYPVYYAPQVNSNYFFYDGMYWVFQSDNWYASSWYNGPWAMVSPMAVPVFMLRIPVRYYRHPPMYFHGWQEDAPPHWGDRWGNDWQRQRRGWDQWNRNSVPTPAPLPTYQRQYSGNRYPSYEQQRAIHGENYHYQPHDPAVQQHYQKYAAPSPQQQRQPQQPQQQQQHQQHQEPQEPSSQDHRSQGQSKDESKQPKQDKGNDPSGKGQDKGHGDET